MQASGVVMWARRPEWVHRVVMGDAMLAAPGGERRTLQGLAAAIWVVLDEPLTVEELTEELRDLADGVAPGLDTVEEGLQLMEDHGVVERLWSDAEPTSMKPTPSAPAG